MLNSLPSSTSSSTSNSFCIGAIPVAVPLTGDPNSAPSGISPTDPMVETRSGETRRLEDMLSAAMADLTATMADADRRREELDKARDQSEAARDLMLRELREEFLALQVQQNEIMSRFTATGGGGAVPPGGGGAGFHGRQQQYFATRQSKVGFPLFSGEDLQGWIMRCDHFFTVDLTPEDAKVRLAIINLEGRALQWYKNWSKYHEFPMATPWPLFLQALESRFGDHLLGDPMSELLSLKQTGSFADYHDRFELLLGRVSISESYAISHFINGLRPYVQKAVRLFMPQTLVHAYALARLQDLSAPAKDGFSAPPRRFSPPSPSGTSLIPSSSPLLPTPTMPNFKSKRVLTPEEMADRRARGLCYGCDEKFDRNHRCVKKQLYILEVDDGDRGVEEVQEVVGDDDCVEEDNPLISIHAISGSSSRGFKTMRITGRVGRRAIHILIDSGSTHNFLDIQLAKRLGLCLTSIRPVAVNVADENSLECTSVCKDLQWSLRGTTFHTKVLLLPLGNCDMVLGVQWLETLGVILWDFKNLTMDFTLEGRLYVLRGGQSEAPITTVSDRKMNKLLAHGEGIQLCCIRVAEDGRSELLSLDSSVQEEQGIPPFIHSFLDTQCEVFKEPTALPPQRSKDHQIVLTPGASPVNSRPYRHTALQKNIIEKQVAELLQQGFIRPSSSPFSSPVVLVKKKDGTWRMCVDYRRLNKITVKDKYPIPLIEELLEELHGAAVFSKIDLRAGYHQIRMKEDDVPKTAFKTHDGHYEFAVMPFGLTNAPATFQSLMNDIFRPFLRKFVLVFFDDILIYSHDYETHLAHLEQVFSTLRDHSLFAKRSKCEFAKSRIEYLGHIIMKEGVATDPRKLQAMQDWPTPTDVSKLRGFLGLTGYYRRFIRNYGVICKPLTDLLRKDAFLWNEEANMAFRLLKEAMISPPVLALPDFSPPFVIETDASSYGIGAVLMQQGHPLAFVSKSLSPKHRLLSVYDKELLAILYAVTHWSHYLGIRPFEVRTDHKTLAHLMRQKLTTPGQLSWLSKLMAYDFEITYKKGADNVVADALSRVHSSEIFCMAITSVSTDLYPLIAATWDADPLLRALILDLQQNPPKDSKFSWLGGQLRRKGRLVVGADEALRLRIIKLFHDTSSGGHSGILATYKRLSSLFYWPNMEKQIRLYIRDCDICQRFKYDNSASPGLLQPLPIPDEAWTQVSLDFIEGLPVSGGKSTILVVVDRLTKYAHFMGLSHPYTALSVAQAFLDSVFKLHGLPTILISDRDKVFMSNFWTDFFKLQGVELHMSTAYHPQSDGQTEVVNRCLETYLRCMCGDQPTMWSRWLSLAEFWYNTSFHSAIQTTPFEALYGYPPPLHIPYFKGDSSVHDVDEGLVAREAMIEVLKHHLGRAQKRMKLQHDRHRSDRQFAIGDWVYLKLQPYRQNTLRDRQFQKLSPRYFGPFKVVDKFGPVAYKLLLPAGCKIHPVFHVSQLKRKMGPLEQLHGTLPSVGNSTFLEPVKILDRRLVKRGNQPATQVLVHWANSFPEDATWEFLYDLQERFPHFKP